MNIQCVFGINVRRFREARGWSQDQLSEVSGLHRTYISGIERGVRNPSIKIASEIAAALGVTVDRLFEDETRIV